MGEQDGRRASEAAFAQAAFAGDRAAFTAIVRRFQDPIYRACLRYVGATEAEDVAQETFMRAFVHRERFDPKRPLLPWLLTIARRLCLDRLRKRSPDLDAEIERAPATDPNADLESVFAARERLQALQRHLAGLPEGQREALTLYHLEGLSYAQIAESLDVAQGTVMTWLHRGRAALRRKMAAQEAAPQPTPSSDPSALGVHL